MSKKDLNCGNCIHYDEYNGGCTIMMAIEPQNPNTCEWYSNDEKDYINNKEK